MMDLESGKIFHLNTIKVIVIDEGRTIFDKTITGQVVNVSLGVAEEGSFTVNGVTASSEGVVVVIMVEHPRKLKSGEQGLVSITFCACF